MRAIFHKEKFLAGDKVILTDDKAHHLNVTRAKVGDEILLLNGMGEKAVSVIESVSKKEIMIKICKVELGIQGHQLELAIAMPKKDAFEDILKMAVELGVVKIHPLSSDFSQFDYTASERIDRLIESALIQSNNLFWPEIASQISLTEFLKNNNSNLVYFSSTEVEDKIDLNSSSKIVILIGPEGGFSATETEQILKASHVNQIHFNTPILRAPTAVATSIGYLLSRIK